jgi:hypothetical protein
MVVTSSGRGQWPISSASVEHLKTEALAVLASIDSLWQGFDDSVVESDVGHLLSGALDLPSYVCRTVAEGSGSDPLKSWWTFEKLDRWVLELPQSEARLGGAIQLLKSWAAFEPKTEGGSEEVGESDEMLDEQGEDASDPDA